MTTSPETKSIERQVADAAVSKLVTTIRAKYGAMSDEQRLDAIQRAILVGVMLKGTDALAATAAHALIILAETGWSADE